MNSFNISVSDKLSKEVLYYTTSNGLRVYFFNTHDSNAEVSFYVNFGGVDESYLANGKEIKTWSGLAHFLEHKMFAMPYGDYFDYASKHALHANAYTSSDLTCYYVSGNQTKIDLMLEGQVDMLSKLVADEQAIEKEKNIILQELMLSKDDINSLEYDTYMTTLFNANDWESILGSENDIKSITLEDLQLAHRNLYTTNNMFVTIACDTDKLPIETTIRKIEELSKKFKTKKIKLLNEKTSDKSRWKFNNDFFEFKCDQVKKTYRKTYELEDWDFLDFHKLEKSLDYINEYINSPLNEDIVKLKEKYSKTIFDVYVCAIYMREFRKAVIEVRTTNIKKAEKFIVELSKLIKINDEELKLIKQKEHLNLINNIDNCSNYSSIMIDVLRKGDKYIFIDEMLIKKSFVIDASECIELWNKLFSTKRNMIFFAN